MSGVILVDKPAGMTSFGVVARIRRMTGEKCGHSGTLDPFATGLLPVMTGSATKLCSLLTEGEKEYQGTLRFGLSTDTEDITGTVLRQEESHVTKEQLLSVLPLFTGEITQKPPAYSAIKVGGVPLYKKARAGMTAEAPERKVMIPSLTLEDFSPEKQEAVLTVVCSKGTYIRSLFRDLAKAAGTIGTTAALRRIRVGRFSVHEAISLEKLEEAFQNGAGDTWMHSLPEVLSDYPSYTPPDFFAGLLQNGCAVAVKKLPGLPEKPCVLFRNGVLIGLADRVLENGETCLKVGVHL